MFCDKRQILLLSTNYAKLSVLFIVSAINEWIKIPVMTGLYLNYDLPWFYVMGGSFHICIYQTELISVLQVIYAIAIGFVFVMINCKTKSLLTCVTA